MLRWIAYGALGIWISGALLDLVIAAMRVLYSTREYGRPLKSTLSYFVGGVYDLLAFGALAWLFYWDRIGEFWTIMIGCLVWLPGGVYLVWRIYSEPQSIEHDPPSTID